jgi:hypothetical protein
MAQHGGLYLYTRPRYHGGMKSPKILEATKAPKLSRRKVAEALQAVPVDVVLLGAVGAKQTKLTAKQRAFAEGVAMGKSKAGAYRDAYSSNAKPHHQSLEGQRLAANPAIAQQITALELANEAMRYATPAALRALVIQKLTEHAISEDVKPAQRLQALKLLGTVTEVAAFTERREIIKTTDAGAARAALLENLRQALRSSATDAQIIETKGPRVTPVTLADPDAAQASDAPQPEDPQPVADAAQADPTAPPPPAQRAASAHTMLSNSHTGSALKSEPEISDATQPSQSAPDLETRVTPVTLPGVNPKVTPVTLTRVNPEVTDVTLAEVGEGDGAMKSWDVIGNGYGEVPPGGNWVEK